MDSGTIDNKFPFDIFFQDLVNRSVDSRVVAQTDEDDIGVSSSVIDRIDHFCFIRS